MIATQRLYFVLAFGFAIFFASIVRANPISKAICNEISKKKEASALLFHDGRLWQESQPIDLGELEATAGKTDISSTKESYLILTPAMYTASGYEGSNLGISLKEVPSLCAAARQYKIRWNVNPKNFGPGKFEDQFDLSFEGPGNNGYSPDIKILFRTVVTGLVHGPGSTIEIDGNAAKAFFSGNSNVLSFQIRNSGDRNLRLNTLAELPTNPKEIRLKHTDCSRQEIAPASSCTVELELRSRLNKPGASISYGLASNSNDVGSSTTEFHFDYDGKERIKTYIKLWE